MLESKKIDPKKRILIYIGTIFFWYVIRSVFESFNFNPTTWEQKTVIKFFVLVVISLAVEEYFLRKK